MLPFTKLSALTAFNVLNQNYSENMLTLFAEIKALFYG
tara:strand:- start:742 stop:855 length:114 start_codon:yes stop_codon:yes gene_type:complete